MQFLNPQLLWLMLLAIVPIALYLFRRKSKTVRVSTLVFFKTLAREHQESAWLRRLKKWLSFLLTILVLALVVFVLARLVAKQDDPDQYRTVVLLVDRSASMAVEDSEGESRIEAARRILTERLERVPEEVGVALVAYDVRPEVVQPRTHQRRELISRLEGVEVRPMAGDPTKALETARLIAGLEKPAVIWHVSDRPLSAGERESDESRAAPDDEERDPELESEISATGDPGVGESSLGGDGVEIRELGLALDAVTNAGITAFQIRPVPLEYSRYEIYVQLALNAAAEETVTSRLEVSVGGIPNQFREFDLDPGERVGLTFRLDGVSDQLLQLRLATEGDRFDYDDHVVVPLPQQSPILAAWIRPDDAEDPYTRLALSSIQESGRFELLKGSPDAWPLGEEVDAVIFDGWLPEEWPSNLPAIVIDPPGSVGPVRARRLENPIPYESVRVGNGEHPVLFRVSSGRISVTQTALIESTGSLEPLWIAGSEPVLSAGEIAGQRLVLVGFSPGRSERLPLTASFPLLMGNALLWVVDRDSETTGVSMYRTGELASVEADSIEWQEWTGDGLRTRRIPVDARVVEMDRIGAWSTEAGVKGGSHLLSALESDLPRSSGGGDEAYFTIRSGSGGHLQLWLLGSVLLLLLLESFLFHRHAVY